MSEGIYYLKLGGKVEGPYTIGQIYDLWAARKINSQTPFARLEEMDKWQPLAELTLTISPPRPAIPKAPASEAMPTMSARARSMPSLRPEDYMAAHPPKAEPAGRASKRHRAWAADLIAKFPLRLEFAIGLCLAAGVLLALYFMIFFPVSPDGKEIGSERLITKLCGVVAGIGLVLMGGLLMVAYQIKRHSAAAKIEAESRSERRLPPTHG